MSLLPCALAGVEAVAADTARRFGRHTHDQFGIGLLYRGAQASASGRGAVEAVAGDVITVNPGEVHDGSPLGTDGRAWCMLYLEPAVMSAAIADLSEGAADIGEFPAPVLNDAATAAAFRALYAAATATMVAAADDICGLARQSGLLRLLAVALREPGAPAVRPAAPPPIATARARLDDDPAASVTLDELAALTGLSRFQVVRGFVRATGLPPHAYLMQRRLALARRLITGGMPLAEAAAASGFADQSHMTRLFTRAYGLPPGAYAAAARRN